jgi:hypothetical protein
MAVKNETNAGREDAAERRNEDAITGAPGSHPVGSGLGAALGGAATGAVAGLAAGPVGTVIGTIAGGIAGGLAGKAVAENIDPSEETNFWQNEHRNRPYYEDDYVFEDYEPAYRAGWESYDPAAASEWTEREQLARDRWQSSNPTMPWEKARPAAQDAYTRVHQRYQK